MTRAAAPDVIWRAQAGPQAIAALCPADLILFGGSRGGGKTDCSIGRHIAGAARYGADWSGLWVRKNYKHFRELRRRLLGLIARGLPAKLTGGDSKSNTLRFSNGAEVFLTAVEREEQLEFFQGQQFVEISIEELCQFPFVRAMLDRFQGCLRSAAGVPASIFATANPGGPGHPEVKAQFIDGRQPNHVYRLPDGRTQVFIPSSVEDNVILCEADPAYVARLRAISDPALRAAWLEGDWDTVLGGFFSDVIRAATHKLPPFRPPVTWARLCSFDYGSGRPFSVGWWAVADGQRIRALPDHHLPRGALVRYAEWYGASAPNVGLRLEAEKIAAGIAERELARGESTLKWDRIADPSIWGGEVQNGRKGPSIMERMAARPNQIQWRRGDNARVQGWDQLRGRLRGGPDGPMLYVTANCVDWWRTVPVLSRDELDWEDIDTESEDHAADETRYACQSRPFVAPTEDQLVRLAATSEVRKAAFNPFVEA